MPILKDEIVSLIAMSFIVGAEILSGVADSVARDMEDVRLLANRVFDAVFGGNPAFEQNLSTCKLQSLLDLLCFSFKVEIRKQK